ncbi:dihydroxy-acid dehydratase [uncultured Microbacterium sp.]|uniref:dihydroxy-acid dehydratase n=1 Tax=uncultured Microbacterium sp. TaxID=191216 RepID=UPI0035CC1BFE
MSPDASEVPGPPSRQYRSQKWTEATGVDGFLNRSSLKVQGLRPKDYAKPIIGICNNTSEFTRCHLHFDNMVTAVKESILQSGGLPRVFNTMTMGADNTNPMGSSFMHRNLMAMEIEQTASIYAMDGIVFLGACDETIPAMLMAAASIDLPAIVLPGGPALTGFWRGQNVGPGIDFHRALDAQRRGELTADDISSLEDSLERSPGHCSTMGTASTMTAIAEALGMAPAGSSAIPAVDSRRLAMSRNVGEYIMQLVENDLRPKEIMTVDAFDNAIRLLAAVDGSSAAVMHLLAIAGRLGVGLHLDRFDQLSADTPVLLNLRPAGDFYMTDFFEAGGVPALLHELRPLINTEVITVTGRSLAEEIEGAVVRDRRVIASLEAPISEPRGIAVLYGNVAPDGAIIRTGVASANLLAHEGRAVVFDGRADLDARLYDPEFDIRPGDIVVLRGEGPRASGMPESGRISVPQKLLDLGITDLVRVTDSRLGGTVKGTAVVHVSPESAAGGPLGLIETGDIIALDVVARSINIGVSADELERRRELAGSKPARPLPERGFARLYAQSVTQANTGCDFDFLLPLPHAAENPTLVKEA